MASSWKSLTAVPTFTPDTMLLMTDGTVLVHDAGGKDWHRLKPDDTGDYHSAAASWSGPFSMANTRQFFASGVLADGSVFVLGGEYSDAGNDTPLGEIFDPQTNTWAPMNKPASFNWIQGDVSACILEDGRVLFGALTSNRSAIWDPAINAWTEAGRAFNTLSSPTKVGTIDEETWSLLPDGTVLTVDISSPPFAEKYVPATDTWVVADQTPATLTQNLALLSLTDTTVTPPVPVNIGEIGPAILLPDGRLFFIGATGHTALYTNPTVASQPGSWTAGHDLPPDTSGKNFNTPNGNIQTSIDAPAVLLPGGRVLLVGGQTVREVSSSGQTEFWSNPSTVFIYDPPINGLTKLASQPPSNGVDTWQSRFLLLPNGQVLMTTQQAQTITILVDAAVIGTPSPAWKPVITAFTPVMIIGHHYKISGKQINGLSQACCYGDDAQMATNFPLARFTNNTTGAVSYFRTFDFSTLAVATGPAVHSTLVEIPSSAIPGGYKIQIIANGIASDPVDVNIVPAAPVIAVNVQDDLLFGTVCSEPQFLTIEVFNVGNADLIADSVERLSGSSDFTVLANPVTPLTIGAGEQVNFTVRFEPTARGVLETATIRIISNDPVTPDFDLTTSGTRGTGSLEAVIVDNGNFGDVCLGRFSDTELTLNNNGPCQLSILDITASPEFEIPSVLSFPLIVGAGDSIEIPIRFQPTSYGAKSAAITITSDDQTSPKVIEVSGNAPAPRLVTILADAGNFGKVCLDSFADERVTLCNAGSCTLTVSDITSSSSEFLVPSLLVFPFTIEAGNAIEVPIRFQPAGHGARSAIITVFSNDPAGPRTIAVSGDSPSGKLAITGSTFFGGVAACCRAERTVSICNVGSCKLHVSSVLFRRKNRHWKLINNPFPATLHPGSCLSVVIRYKATEKCPRSCDLVITSDDPHMPVKTLEVIAYTVWNDCCRECCDECRKETCQKRHNEPGCCEKCHQDCCDEEDEEEQEEEAMK